MRALRASSQPDAMKSSASSLYCVPRSLPAPGWHAPPDNPHGAPGPAPPAWAPAWCRCPCRPAPVPGSRVTAARPPWPGRYPHAGARCPPGAGARHPTVSRFPPAAFQRAPAHQKWRSACGTLVSEPSASSAARQTAPAAPSRPARVAASRAGPPPARPPADRSAAQTHPSGWHAACTPHPRAAPGRQSSRTPRRCRPVVPPAQSGRHRTDCPAHRH